MTILRIPLEGQLTEVERKRIDIESLVLDVENPRIQYFLDSRLNPEITPEQIMQAIAVSNDQYEKLRDSIELNEENNFYRVIEGNSRALVYKELKEKHWNNDKWKQIEAYILPHAIDKAKINFIRLEAHLFGVTPWDAYEKARELYRLHSQEDYSIMRLEQLTKLKSNDIKTNIEAFKDMEDQYLPKYNKPGEQLKFSYFAEFRKSKRLKELFHDKEITLTQFSDLVGQGKFGRGEQVRKLAMVWEDREARQVLLEEDMEAALDQLSLVNPAAKSKLFEKIVDVTSGLGRLPFNEAMEIRNGLQPAKASELKNLYRVLRKLLKESGMLDNGEL
jgi:hypothetical protein